MRRHHIYFEQRKEELIEKKNENDLVILGTKKRLEKDTKKRKDLGIS